jgi:pimeloyl-ACP methyl ester carboxylesterase
MNAPVPRANVTLDDKFNVQSGWIYLTGTQALTRLPIQQAIRDKAAVRFLAPVPASARVRLRVVRAGSSRRMAADRHENLEHARGGGIGQAGFDRRSFGAPQLLAMAGWSSLPCLWSLRQPTLVLMGSDYPLVLPVDGRILASLIPNAELRMIDDGQLFMVTRPAEVAAVTEEFLAKESK